MLILFNIIYRRGIWGSEILSYSLPVFTARKWHNQPLSFQSFLLNHPQELLVPFLDYIITNNANQDSSAEELHPLAFLPRWLMGGFLALKETLVLWETLDGPCISLSEGRAPLHCRSGASGHPAPTPVLWCCEGFSPMSFGEVLSQRRRFGKERAASVSCAVGRFEIYYGQTLSPQINITHLCTWQDWFKKNQSAKVSLILGFSNCMRLWLLVFFFFFFLSPLSTLPCFFLPS